MSAVRASAPGKLLVFGEYAVLAGGTAVVLAVDRRARVAIDPTESDDLHVVAPQLDLPDDGLVFDPESPDRRLGLTGRLLADRLAHYRIDAAGLRIEIDTAELFERDADAPAVKLGLGSSAAVAAALDTALAAQVGHARAGFEALLPAYRRALDAPASGADLAASLGGGLRRVRAGDTRSLDWPEGLVMQAVWVGQPASTPAFASAFAEWRSRHPDAVADWVERMDGITERALEQATADAWRAAAVAWGEGLVQLQAALGLEILTPIHQTVAEVAASHGVAYKTSGAGGGDFGFALTDDPDALAAFAGRVLEVGGRPVELALDSVGARDEAPAR